MFVGAKGSAQVSGKKIDLFEVDEAPDSLSLSLFQAGEQSLHERTGHWRLIITKAHPGTKTGHNTAHNELHNPGVCLCVRAR